MSERGDLRLICDLRQKLDLALVCGHEEADGVSVLRVLRGDLPRLTDCAVEYGEVALVLDSHRGPEHGVAANLNRLLKRSDCRLVILLARQELLSLFDRRAID